jgi:hypothetical protein
MGRKEYGGRDRLSCSSSQLSKQPGPGVDPPGDGQLARR